MIAGAPAGDPARLDRPPLDPAAVDRVLAPLAAAAMLPPAAYTSAEVYAWEQRQLLAGTWSCAGREDDLRSPRLRADRALTQRAIMVGDVGVLITWPPDGTVRAFANTCRHRAHELLPADGAADRTSVICPYHAWTYDLAGRLRSRATGTPESGLDLVELPVRRWQGWIFVHAATPRSRTGWLAFDDHLGAMARIVEPYAPAALVLGARHTYEVAANWKVITENYHECYHCPLIHPELCRVSPPDSGDNYDLPGWWVGGSMLLREGMQTMSITGRSYGRVIDDVPTDRVEYLGLFPDLLLSLHPDYVMAHRLRPLAPDRTFVECSWYFPDATVDPTYAVEFWDRTNRQDWAACESVQRGLASPHAQPGPFASTEDAVHQFTALVARLYRGDPRSAVGAGAR